MYLPIDDKLTDITTKAHVEDANIINRDPNLGDGKTLFEHSESLCRVQNENESASKTRDQKAGWVQSYASNARPRLLICISFMIPQTVGGLRITSLRPTSFAQWGDKIPTRPKIVEVIPDLAMEDADLTLEAAESLIEDGVKTRPDYRFNLTAQGWDADTGTIDIKLQPASFKNIRFLAIRLTGGDAANYNFRCVVRVHGLRILGKTPQRIDLSKLGECNKWIKNAKLRNERYMRSGDIEQLYRAIGFCWKAVAASTDLHRSRHVYLNEFGCYLLSWYERTGSRVVLDRAVLHLGEAARVAHLLDSEYQAKILSTLGTSLGKRFQCSGKLEDLEASILICDEALHTSSADRRDRPRLLSNLACGFHCRYQKTANLADLQKATKFILEAVQSLSPSTIKNLGFSITGTIVDNAAQILSQQPERDLSLKYLETAGKLGRLALKLAPSPGLDRPRYLCSLSLLLHCKYRKTKNLMDLDEAFDAAEEANNCKSPCSAIQSKCAYCLSLCLFDRHRMDTKTDSAVKELDLAVWNARRAVEIMPDNYENRQLYYSHLGLVATIRGHRKRSSTDLEEGVEFIRKAAKENTTSDLLSLLCGVYNGFVSLTRNPQNWDGATLLWVGAAQKAITNYTTVPFERFQAYEKYVDPKAWQSMEAMVLRSTVDWRGRGVDLPIRAQLYHSTINTRLEKLEGVDALSLWEYGRGILWRMFLSYHLKGWDTPRGNNELPGSHQDEVVYGDNNWRFNDLLRPLCPNEILDLARKGPIVSIHVSNERSTAFIVTTGQVITIKLPEKLNSRSLRQRARKLVGKKGITRRNDLESLPYNNKELCKILAWLWDNLVAPVLKALDLLKDPPPEGLPPRLWWVTSGMIGLFPLHAAGKKGAKRTLDYVVSSYTSTLQALQHARRLDPFSSGLKDDKVLFIKVPKTTGYRDLEVEGEIQAIEEFAKPFSNPSDILETPSKAEVLTKLENHSIVHFACHGLSDPADPQKSCLLLKDDPHGKPERLTVGDLVWKSSRIGRMAYLSACSTAENSGEKVRDEVIHLASAFQLLGFPHVIGTLWEARDSEANELASHFYKELAQEILIRDSHEAFATALHNASRKMINNTIEMFWAQFVHIGC